MAIVYKHLKPDGEIFYIGIGVVEKRAFSKHGRNNHWHNTIKKHGYSVEIICDDVDYNTAKKIEKYLIRYYGRKDLGLGSLVNFTDGGEGALNVSQKERDIKAKRIREYNKNKKDYSFTQTKCYKNKMSKATLDKGCKRIKNIVTGEVYNSQKDVSKDIGYSISYLSQMLNGKRKNKTNLEWM